MPVQEDTKEMNKRALKEALAHFRDQQFAEMFAVWFGLACHTHPERMKDAWRNVFDLRTVEELTRNAETLSQQAAEQAQTAATQADIAKDKLSRIEAQLNRLEGLAEHLLRKNQWTQPPNEKKKDGPRENSTLSSPPQGFSRHSTGVPGFES